MPVYQVTDSQTGQQLRLTGDSPPTEQELEEIFTSTRAQADSPVAREAITTEQPQEGIPPLKAGIEEPQSSQPVADGLSQIAESLKTMPENVTREQIEAQLVESGGLEVLESIARAPMTEVAAGIAGIAQGLNPFAEPRASTQAVESVRESLAVAPETEAGREKMTRLAETMAPVTNAIEAARNFLGDETYEKTGSPLLAAGATALPDAVLAAFPATAARMSAKRTAFKVKIANKIKAGETSSDVAKYISDGANGVVKDVYAINAIKQGFDESVISAIKGATRTDRVKMQAMTNIVKKAKSNALYGTKNRPSDVAGNTLMERVRHIKKMNTSAGKRLGTVAKSLKGKDADFTPAIKGFTDSLDEMGVTITDDLKPSFAGSDVEGLAAPQNAISNIIKRMSSGKRGATPDAYDMHRMKKYIDEQVTYGKSAEGLAGKTERVLKKLRRDLDSALDNEFPAYNKVNTRYADTVSALDSLQDVAGKKMDLFGPNADKAIGTLLRRLMGNAQSRVNLVDAVDDIERITKKYGGKFKDDVAVQMLYADELDNVFGPSTRTSFKAEIGKEIHRAAVGASKESLGADAASKLIERARGINNENAFKAINKVLER